jgi:hypothetical protein
MPLLSFQQKFVDQVDLALDEIRAGGNSVGIALVGPSGSGKTHGIDVIAARFLATGEGRDRTIPLIRTTAASLNGSPAMARSILKLHGVRPEIVKKTIDVEAAANHSIEMRSTDIFVFEGRRRLGAQVDMECCAR